VRSAAQTLWGPGEDGQLARQIILGLLVPRTGQMPVVSYVALLRSKLRDDEIARALEKQLAGFGAGDFTGGWLVPRPEAFDVVSSNLTNRIASETCLSQERATRSEDYAQAILTGRAVMLGCRDTEVLRELDLYIRNGAPGFVGATIDPKLSEAYGYLLIENRDETCSNGAERLWKLLKSPCSEASKNYRLAVQYALAGLVLRAPTDSESQTCQTEVLEKIKSWADDEVPHHRAAFVNLSSLIREGMNKKKLILLRTEF
jgi:hypothetical protein